MRIQSVGNYDGAYLVRRSPSEDSWRDDYVEHGTSLNERLTSLFDDEDGDA
jgi:hypothetical protein